MDPLAASGSISWLRFHLYSKNSPCKPPVLHGVRHHVVALRDSNGGFTGETTRIASQPSGEVQAIRACAGLAVVLDSDHHVFAHIKKWGESCGFGYLSADVGRVRDAVDIEAGDFPLGEPTA